MIYFVCDIFGALGYCAELLYLPTLGLNAGENAQNSAFLVSISGKYLSGSLETVHYLIHLSILFLLSNHNSYKASSPCKSILLEKKMKTFCKC
jgi:hypothetical protein